VLADLEGPGTLRHFWLTIPPQPPERMRAQRLEVFYDGLAEPSVSVPVVDFFGLPHGRPVPYDSALVSVHEGRGFNAYFPMPFRRRVRVEYTNESERPVLLFYQLDWTREREIDPDCGYLHASFRRENPTVMQRDFTIASGLRGPGRFLGASFGVRVLDEGAWYGEGEVKVYRDGDDRYPTICGTGLEDYVGSAWGIGQYQARYAGAPLHVRRRYARSHPAAGAGWERAGRPGVLAQGIAERIDDYCATAYVYCREPQPVPRLDAKQAIADVARLDYEEPGPLERLFGG
jgi:hypothetical protein